ncbi:hypothetical protein MTO96_024677 [Rhipicephalus appendiculatus]
MERVLSTWTPNTCNHNTTLMNSSPSTSSTSAQSSPKEVVRQVSFSPAATEAGGAQYRAGNSLPCLLTSWRQPSQHQPPFPQAQTVQKGEQARRRPHQPPENSAKRLRPQQIRQTNRH